MSRSLRLLVPGFILLAVSSCGDDLLSPDRQRQSEAAAARAVTPSLNTYWVSASRINLEWVDNVRNETGWEVHRSIAGATGAFTLLASLGANTTTYSNADLAALTEYCYKVRSFKKSGPNVSQGAFTPVSCTTTPGPPAAPSALSAVPAGSNTVDVSWTNNASTAEGVRLEWSADGAEPWQLMANLGASAQSFRNFGRAADQPVCYRVIATNTHGPSTPSNVDCTSPPRTPTNIAAVAGSNSITVTWTDASTVEDGYEVERARDDYVFAAVGQLDAGSASFTDGSVLSDTRYWYRVRAKKDGGFSEYSGWAWAAVASGPPRAPENVYVSPAGSTVARISWTNLSPTVTGFRIERSTDNQASWVPAGEADRNASEFYEGERTTESQVCYRVFAQNSVTESPASTPDCTVPPAAPTNIATVYQEDGSTLVTWNDNSNAEDGYEIWTMICWDDYYYGWYCDYFSSYWSGENTSSTSLSLYSGEFVAGMYAISDGGYSDGGTWAGESSAALRGAAASQRVVRPVKGERAPAALSTRARAQAGKIPLDRRSPK
jgi:hypothetical protein